MQRTLTRDNKLTNYTMTIFFGDKRLFQSKIAIFSQQLIFCTPEDWCRHRVSKTRTTGYRADKEASQKLLPYG